MHRVAVPGGAQRRQRECTAHWLDDAPRWPAHGWQPRIVIRATPFWGAGCGSSTTCTARAAGDFAVGAASGSGAGAFGSVVEHAADASSHAV